MPSFTTIYRTIVMIAAGVIVVKGWQHYGPTNEQVKALGERAIDMAQGAWNDWQQASPTGEPAADPRTLAAPAAEPPAQSLLQPAPLDSAVPPPGAAAIAPAMTAPPLATWPPPAAAPDHTHYPAEQSDRLPVLMSRLEELGGVEPELAPWGSSGQFYRFCCRAAWAETPTYTRHFEAVAPEPLAAVEQVVAKVEAWRAAQRDETVLR